MAGDGSKTLATHGELQAALVEIRLAVATMAHALWSLKAGDDGELTRATNDILKILEDLKKQSDALDA